MHGIFRMFGQTMDNDALSAETALLTEKFKPLLNALAASTSSAAPGTESIEAERSEIKRILKFMMAPPQQVGELPIPENPFIPAGYTYFGQLISHDLSFHRFLGDVSPALRLRTLYGSGPAMMPYLYQYKPLQTRGLTFHGVKFALDTYTSDSGAKVYDLPRHKLSQDPDVPQRQNSIPLAADARNDQNFLLSQLTVAFARIHNFVVDAIRNPAITDGSDQGELFQKASQIVIALYQAVILYDYLPRLLFDPALVGHLKNRDNFLFFDVKGKKPGLSEVFTRAAFRFGHAQIKQVYSLSKTSGLLSVFGSNESLDLRGFIRDSRRSIEWDQFFAFETGQKPQSSKQINHMVSLPLRKLPFLPKTQANLAEINLMKSQKALPPGLGFYKALRDIEADEEQRDLLTPDERKGINEVSASDLVAKIVELSSGLIKEQNLPLWLLILLEAELLGGGLRLGPLGSRIVAEQIMWTLLEDRGSVLNTDVSKELAQLAPMGLENLKITDLLSWLEPPVIKPSELLSEVSTRSLEPQSMMTTRSLDNIPNPAYKGDELQALTLAGYTVHLDRVKGLSQRNAILSNGYYDITTPRTENYFELFENHEYSEPGGKSTQLIKVYISRKSILYHLGLNTAVNYNQVIRGVMFTLGIEEGVIHAVVEPTGEQGERIAGTTHYWYLSNLKWLVKGDGTYTDDAGVVRTRPLPELESEANALKAAFVQDAFATLRSAGMPDIVIKGSVLTKLLGETASGTLPDVTFSLAAATGQEIINAHGLPTPADTGVPGASFITLALKSSVNGVSLYSERSRPYPPWCYPGN